MIIISWPWDEYPTFLSQSTCTGQLFSWTRYPLRFPVDEFDCFWFKVQEVWCPTENAGNSQGLPSGELT